MSKIEYKPRPLIEHIEGLQEEILREIDHKTKPQTGIQASCHSPYHMIDIQALHALRWFCRNAIDDWEIMR